MTADERLADLGAPADQRDQPVAGAVQPLEADARLALDAALDEALGDQPAG